MSNSVHTPSQMAPPDIALVSRLQNRVKELERERARLQRELDRRDGAGEGGPNGDPERDIYDTIKVSSYFSLYMATFNLFYFTRVSMVSMNLLAV